MIVPAAPLSALGPRPHPVTAPSAAVAAARALSRRRTVIPVLLTGALLLLVTAALKFVVDPDAPLAGLPVWVPFGLIVLAAVILGVAGLNMAQVRKQLAAAGRDTGGR